MNRMFSAIEHEYHDQLSGFENSICIEEDGRFGCVRCGKSYKNRRHLVRHLTYECGQQPRFSCTFCPHRSRYKTDLKTHMFVKHADQFQKKGDAIFLKLNIE